MLVLRLGFPLWLLAPRLHIRAVIPVNDDQKKHCIVRDRTLQGA
jgi:hypothetical protein